MSRELVIKNGPSFRGFAIMNGIITESEWDQVFTMDRVIPDGFITIHENKKVFQISLLMFGKSPRSTQGENDEFIFIATKYGKWFYVGTYNTRTRKGKCREYTGPQFFLQVDLNELLNFPR